MAKPWSRDASPMPSASGTPVTPISYQANVNRRKTKKWTEARKVDYGGDDWGDEYEDEYPPEINPPRTTGLRQPGQAIRSDTASSPRNEGRKGYGDLPSIAAAGQDRSFTTPMRERANSFDQGDERRAFSFSSSQANPLTEQQIPPIALQSAAPPVLHVQTKPITTGLRKLVQSQAHAESQVASAIERAVPTEELPSSSSKYSQSTGYGRDASPGAGPSPLQARQAPAPQLATDAPSTRFPPRKSSIGLYSPPEVPLHQQPTFNQGNEIKQSTDSQSEFRATPKSSTSPSKALPFIRPADIYKRHLEEKVEKEHQSSESGRPSIDSITRSDRSVSPTRQRIPLAPTPDNQANYDYDAQNDGGRHLVPMLEPVQERKSEYGFDDYGFQNPSSGKIPEELHHSVPVNDSKYDYLGAEQARRFSTSPKLPDLNRISTFEMDLFGPPTKPTETTEAQAQGPILSDVNTSASEDGGLLVQPLLEITSVVDRAFNVPADSLTSPAETTKRSDSQSTGTTGISPIMSGVSSGAPLEARNKELQTRDQATPVIIEAEEPDSRRTSTTPAENTVQNDTHDHPDHSDVDASKLSTPQSEGEAGDVSDAVTPFLPQAEDEQVTSRPAVEREHSFRPELPGGWVSYATTATPSVALPIDPENVPDTSTLVAETNKPSREDDDLDITPTTAIRQLPQSALGAAAVATFGRREKSTATQPIESDYARKTESSKLTALPTPDPALAPISSPYAASTVDPRLLPDEPAAQETLHPPRPAFQKTNSSSTIPPTPPPKDTPIENPGGTEDEYFHPTVPLKQKSHDTTATLGPLEVPTHPHILPELDAQTSPQDQESDRLHKEIIKSLSPRLLESDANSEPLPGRLRLDDSAPGTRESTYLASVYDDYWTPNDEVEDSKDTKLDSPPDPGSAVSAMSLPSPDKTSTPSVAPLHTHRGTAESRPSLGGHRFSWEVESEGVSQSHQEASSEDVPVDRQSEVQRGTLYAETPTAQPLESKAQLEPGLNSTAQEATGEISKETYLQYTNLRSSASVVPTQLDISPEVEVVVQDRQSKTTSTVADSSTYPNDEAQAPHQRSSSDKGISREINTQTVPTTLPWGERSSTSTQDITSPAELSAEPMQFISNGPIELPTPEPMQGGHRLSSPPAHQQRPEPHITRPVTDISKIMQIKEIASLKSPEQRIQAYNNSRHQYAAMNSGLSDWLQNVKNGIPEIVPFGNYPSGTITSSGRSRHAKSSTLSSPMQQPYYQQYLNASSPTSSTAPARPVAGISGGQQGFSQGGSKITSQQVQAKSKELLHSAGIFGGKASKAGKGLLAKGKNKLRGAGGGDKDGAEPKTNHSGRFAKSDIPRRSSWGLPLTLTRPVGRHTVSSQTPPSREPPVVRPGAPPRLESHMVPHNIANFGEDLLARRPSHSTISRPVSADHIRSGSRPLSEVSPERLSLEERDGLGVPAPIGKNQPSWDPSNASPIDEEEGFVLEGQNQETAPKPVADTEPAAALPVASTSSDRSGSEDVYTDAPEEQSQPLTVREVQPVQAEEQREQVLEKDDWVVIPRASESLRYSALEKDIEAPSYESEARRLTYSTVAALDHPPYGEEHYSEDLLTESAQRGATAWVGKPEAEAAQDEQDDSFIGLPPIRRSSLLQLTLDSDHEEPDSRTDIDDASPPKVEDEHSCQGHESVPRPLHGLRPASQDISHYVNRVMRDGSVPQLGKAVRPLAQWGASSDYSQSIDDTGSGKLSFEDKRKVPHVDDRFEQISKNSELATEKLDTVPSSSSQSVIEETPMITPPSHIQQPSYQTREQLEATVARLMGQPTTVESPRGRSASQPGSQAQAPMITTPKCPDEPPSAHRYPELSRTGSGAQPPSMEDEELLDVQYYQAAVSNGQDLLPRQQTNEERMHGFKPVVDVGEPESKSSRRSSGFFRIFGNKISSSSSRDRRSATGLSNIQRELDSRGSQLNPKSSSGTALEQAHERKKHRSGLFGVLVRSSTAGDVSQLQHRGIQALPPDLRQEDVVRLQDQSFTQKEGKRSFFGGSRISLPIAGMTNQLSRTSTNVSGLITPSQENKRSSFGVGERARQQSLTPSEFPLPLDPSRSDLDSYETKRSYYGGSQQQAHKASSQQVHPQKPGGATLSTTQNSPRFAEHGSYIAVDQARSRTQSPKPSLTNPFHERKKSRLSGLSNLFSSRVDPEEVNNSLAANISPIDREQKSQNDTEIVPSQVMHHNTSNSVPDMSFQSSQLSPNVRVMKYPPLMTPGLLAHENPAGQNQPLPPTPSNQIPAETLIQTDIRTQPRSGSSEIRTSPPSQRNLFNAGPTGSLQPAASPISHPSVSSIDSHQAISQAGPADHIGQPDEPLQFNASRALGYQSDHLDGHRSNALEAEAPSVGSQNLPSPPFENNPLKGLAEGIRGAYTDIEAGEGQQEDKNWVRSPQSTRLDKGKSSQFHQTSLFNKASPNTRVEQQKSESKSRRHSGARLLGGLLGLHSSKQVEKNVARNSASGSALDSTQNSAPHSDGAQTYQQHPEPPGPHRLPMETQGTHRSVPERKAPVNISTTPDWRRNPERGRPLFKEPLYAPTPIPGAYGLVIGDGSMPAPGSYDPRLLSQQMSPRLDPKFTQQSPSSCENRWHKTQTPPQQFKLTDNVLQQTPQYPHLLNRLSPNSVAFGDPYQTSPSSLANKGPQHANMYNMRAPKGYRDQSVADGNHGQNPEHLIPLNPDDYPHEFLLQPVGTKDPNPQSEIHYPMNISTPSSSSEVTSRGRSLGSLGSPVQQFAVTRRMGKPLSTEDIVARSPARLPVGQQPPYQLQLPDEEESSTPIRDRPLPTERLLSEGGNYHIDKPITTERDLPTERPLPAGASMNTNLSYGSHTAPRYPELHPLPGTALSPLNSSADMFPAPPPLWSEVAQAASTPSQVVQRSNTITTFGSDYSLTAEEQPPPLPTSPSHHVQTVLREGQGFGTDKSGSESISPPSHDSNLAQGPDNHRPAPLLNEEITASFDQLSNRNHITTRTGMREPDHSTTPGFDLHHPVLRTTVGTIPPAQILVSASPVQETKENNIQESPKIHTNDIDPTRSAVVGSPILDAVPAIEQQPPEEKIWHAPPDGLEIAEMDGDPQPVMSATSYPGMEWNPYERHADEWVD